MRDWFTTDFGWKIFSVLLAVAIWLTVSKNRSESETVGPTGIQDTLTFDNVRVLIVSAAADVRDFHVRPSEVAVTVSGTHDDIAKLQAGQVRAFVDLTDIESAPRRVQRHVDVTLPSGLKLVRVAPSEVDVIVPPPRDK
jgi:YbbR domain-containing protein